MRRLLGGLVFVVFVATMIGIGSYPERANSAPGNNGSAAIRLGMSLPLSGPVAAYGKALREGAQACFARVNAEGGIHGRKIEVVSLDDGYDTERMLANTRRLINEEKVLSLVGFFGSPGTVEAMQALRTAGIPLIGLSTGTSSLHLQPGRYAFSTRASVEKEVAVIIDHAVPLAVTKIGVIYQDDTFGRAGLDGFVEAMKRHRLSAVASVGFDPAKGITPGVIQQLADAAPQLVLVLATHKPAAVAIRALKKNNATTCAR